MSPVVRSALIGTTLGILVVGAVAAALIADVVHVPDVTPPVNELLVVATAPDAVALYAPFAFVIDTDTEIVTILDPSVPAVISGTSADTPQDAYPFVGAAGVARALTSQTSGRVLPWVVLPSAAWADLIDDAGGIEVVVPHPISTYRDGSVVLIEGGKRRLSGEQVVALASALEYIDEGERRSVATQMSAGLSSAVMIRPAVIAELVAAGKAHSSIEVDEIQSVLSD